MGERVSDLADRPAATMPHKKIRSGFPPVADEWERSFFLRRTGTFRSGSAVGRWLTWAQFDFHASRKEGKNGRRHWLARLDGGIGQI